MKENVGNIPIMGRKYFGMTFCGGFLHVSSGMN